MKMDLEQKCDHFYMARIQRASNESLGIDTNDSYYHFGCYACNGNNNKCHLYSQLADYGFIMNECQDIDL